MPKFYQFDWGPARTMRPSIYQKPIDEPLAGFNSTDMGRYFIPFSNFARFFSEFHELYRDLSKSNQFDPLPFSLAIAKIMMGNAANLSGYTVTFDGLKHPHLQQFQKFQVALTVFSLRLFELGLSYSDINTPEKAESFIRSQLRYCLDEVASFIDMFGTCPVNSIEFPLSDPTASLVRARLTKKPSIDFQIHPLMHPRMAALFLTDLNLLPEQVRKYAVFNDQLDAVFIGTYPWEPDPLLKAQMLHERGIPAMEPLGRAIIGGLEYCAFTWVGNSLYREEDPAYFRRYGEIVRLAHDRGVHMDDIGFHNATVRNREVFVVDMEDIWFERDATPLPSHVREAELRKFLRTRMFNDDDQHANAFMQGYV